MPSVHRHRGDIGGAMLVSMVACWIGAITVAAVKGATWAIISLAVGGAVCLAVALWAFQGWGDIAGGLRRAAGWMRLIPARLANASPIILRSPIAWRGLPASRLPAAARTPTIISATYGADGQQADVTEVVAALYRAGLPFVADNATLVGVDNDPAPGVPKTLEVTVRTSPQRWGTIMASYDENAEVTP